MPIREFCLPNFKALALARTIFLPPPPSHQITSSNWIEQDDSRLRSSQCGHSIAFTGADNAGIRPPADNQPGPVLQPVSASPQQASQIFSPAVQGQISSGDVDTRDDEPRTSIGRLIPIPCIAPAPAPDKRDPDLRLVSYWPEWYLAWCT
ncbi:hypothetical protein CMUS01_05678 [Colletotrichum musicola]|uniref:Uncharacterized protein n=1 Tax=Colletotrichum musicola TaxID=2175873 RepID=A0A8H6KRH5_9PEZI|nr:hypothetical protein CMUS01_05678 [Colletotrichum musicola]